MDSSLDPRSLINNAADLLDAGDRLLPGDRIELFCKIAANRPEVAFPAFMTILRDIADPTYRALALRGLRWIEHPETLQEIRTCETATAQELVQMLASELLGRGQFSTDLTRWAASDAIINLQYPPSVLRGAAFGGLMESPDRIQREITEFWLFKKERLQRFSSQSRLTVEYERFLEFWTFGPVDYLFSERSLDSKDIDLLLNQLSWLGLEIAFQAEAAATSAAYDQFVQHCLQYGSHENKDRLRLELARFFVDQLSESELVEAITTVSRIWNQKDLPNFLNKSMDVAEVQGLQAIIQDVESVLAGYTDIATYLSQVIKFNSITQYLSDSLNNQKILTFTSMASKLAQSDLSSWGTSSNLELKIEAELHELIKDKENGLKNYNQLKNKFLELITPVFGYQASHPALSSLTQFFGNRESYIQKELNAVKSATQQLLQAYQAVSREIDRILKFLDDFNSINSVLYDEMVNEYGTYIIQDFKVFSENFPNHQHCIKSLQENLILLKETKSVASSSVSNEIKRLEGLIASLKQTSDFFSLPISLFTTVVLSPFAIILFIRYLSVWFFIVNSLITILIVLLSVTAIPIGFYCYSAKITQTIKDYKKSIEKYRQLVNNLF